MSLRCPHCHGPVIQVFDYHVDIGNFSELRCLHCARVVLDTAVPASAWLQPREAVA